MPLCAGQRLGPYENHPLLGAGGMGEVYSARDARLGRDVAVKVLRPEVRAGSRTLRRFEQEARAAGALNHPNIVALHDLVPTRARLILSWNSSRAGPSGSG